MRFHHSSSHSDGTLPFHVYLHRQIELLPSLTNLAIAQRLGYARPNVVAMFRNGSMKVPIGKVPALADVLGIDRISLLKRAMAEYSPDLWATIEGALGDGLTTENEAALLRTVRELMCGTDADLVRQDRFVEGLGLLIGDVLDRSVRSELAARAPVRAARDSRISRLNAAMAALLDQQAAERLALRRMLDSPSGAK